MFSRIPIIFSNFPKETLKHFLIFVLAILSSTILSHPILLSQDLDFELLPTKLHFYGTVTSGGNIIVYGSQGSYLLSTDKGNTWKQYSIHPNGYIFHMINKKDTLIGVINNGYIILSTDFGLTWNKLNFNLDQNEELIYLLATEKYYYLRSTLGIYKLDHNFIPLKVSKDKFLHTIIPTINDPGLSSYEPVFRRYSVHSKIELKPFKEYLLCQSIDFYHGLIVLDEDLNLVDTIDAKNYIDDIRNPWIKNFFPFGDYLIISAGVHGLYITDNLFTKWHNFFPDKNFVDSSGYILNELGTYLNEYFFRKNQLFLEKINENPHKRNYLFSYKPKYNSPIIYTFKRYEVDETGKFPSFKTYGSPYYENSISPQFISVYPGDIIENSSVFLSNRFKAFLEDSIVIIAGPMKFLLISQDDFRTWKLLSTCNTKPTLIINDSIYVFSQSRNSLYYNHTATTFDGGILFKPTEYELDTLHRYEEFVGFDSTGKLIDTVYHYIDTVSYFQDISSTQVFFIGEDGKGFLVGGDPIDLENGPYYLAHTSDFGIHFKFDTIVAKKVGHGNNQRVIKPVVFKVKDKYIYSNTREISKDFYQSFITLLDTNFSDAQNIHFSEYFQLLQVYPIDIGHYILFLNLSTTSNPNINEFQIRETTDNGKTLKTLAYLEDYIKMTQFYVHNPDSIFFSTCNPAKIYLFETKTNTLRQIYSEQYLDTIYLMVISDRFYIVGRGLFLENTDRSDLTKWREGKWDYGKPNFESVIFKGNVAIAGLSDSLRPFNYYKITLKKDQPSSVEQEQVEKRYYTTKFWASETYPQPAVTKAKARIAWDGSFDLHEALDGVYDSMGRKVEGKERISIVVRNRAWAEMEWECTGVPAGVYFILFRWAGGSEVVPVVVQ